MKSIAFFVPNEIFNDFKKIKYKSNGHYAYAISYYVLVSYLYFNCIIYSPAEAKQMLGYSKTNNTVNYLTKRDGKIEKINYVKSTINYPVERIDCTDYEVEFLCRNDFDLRKKHEGCITNNFSIKFPKKAFNRMRKGLVVRGTFFDISNTTKIDMRKFFEIMNNPKLGTSAFLIYLKIRNYCLISKSYKFFEKELFISRTTAEKKINLMDKLDIINVERAKYDSDAWFQNSNTYRA